MMGRNEITPTAASVVNVSWVVHGVLLMRGVTSSPAVWCGGGSSAALLISYVLLRCRVRRRRNRPLLRTEAAKAGSPGAVLRESLNQYVMAEHVARHAARLRTTDIRNSRVFNSLPGFDCQ
jgi:hypothetical protein